MPPRTAAFLYPPRDSHAGATTPTRIGTAPVGLAWRFWEAALTCAAAAAAAATRRRRACATRTWQDDRKPMCSCMSARRRRTKGWSAHWDNSSSGRQLECTVRARSGNANAISGAPRPASWPGGVPAPCKGGRKLHYMHAPDNRRGAMRLARGHQQSSWAVCESGPPIQKLARQGFKITC